MAHDISSYLHGDSFAAALQSGIHRVIAGQEKLNAINVFPVADGDTGTNLSLSLGSALNTLTAPGEKHLGTLLAAVADNLLDGSRGNSGAIVAQFFQGMSDSADELSRFTTHTFSRAVKRGSDYAHDALSNPREGTILSVISAFAHSLKQLSANKSEQAFGPLLVNAIDSTKEALAKTQEQLDVLRKAGVVDAGAKGFVELIEGMTDYIAHGKVAAAPDLSHIAEEGAFIETAGAEVDLNYRYCTECIVNGKDIDRRKLRESLSPLGDSLVLAGTKRKAKIHIHVNDPDAVFEAARQFGETSSEKADDMQRQQHSTHGAGAKFAVITDSAADISDDDLDRLDIHVVPLRVQFGGRGYMDKVGITSDEFFAELQSNPEHPTTSQPSPGDFRRQYQFLASHFADVISISLTGRASGTFQAAKTAAERVNASGRIHVLDTLNVSLGQGLLATLAAECAQAGFSAEATLEILASAIPDTISFALIEDLTYAVRGGRVPASRKLLADLLHVSPVLRTMPDGQVSSGGIVLGRNKPYKRFVNYVRKHAPAADKLRVMIGHAQCPDDAAELATLLQERLLGVTGLQITPIGSALGVHAGPGTLVVGVQRHIDLSALAERQAANPT